MILKTNSEPSTSKMSNNSHSTVPGRPRRPTVRYIRRKAVELFNQFHLLWLECDRLW